MRALALEMRPALGLLSRLASAVAIGSAAATPSSAALATFKLERIARSRGAIYSNDGYHYAVLAASGGRESWIKDGRVVDSAAAGTFPKPGSLGEDATAAISDHGGVLLYVARVRGDSARGAGKAVFINGKPVDGGSYEDVRGVQLSPEGRNAGYLALGAGGWTAITNSGSSPVSAQKPGHFRVGSASTVYLLRLQGRNWLYRDHRPVATSGDYTDVAVSPDGRRIAGCLSRDDGIVIEVDGAVCGPWPMAGTPKFGPDGHHFGFFVRRHAGETGYDAVIVDGEKNKIYPMSSKDAIFLRLSPGDGMPFWVEHSDRRGDTIFAAGKRLGSWRLVDLGANWIAFSPSGRHYAFLADRGGSTELVVDGRVLEKGAPLPDDTAVLAFDDEDEFHYMAYDGERMILVCGTRDDTLARKTKCARIGRARAAAVRKAERIGFIPGLRTK